MFTMTKGSSLYAMSVALPDSDCSRHTNPGALSARALIGPSCATNSAIFRSSSGAIKRAILICARRYFMADSRQPLLKDASEIETVAQDAPPDDVADGEAEQFLAVWSEVRFWLARTAAY